MFSRLSKKPISYQSPSDKVAPQYPSVFFESNHGSKPILNIPQSGYTLQEVRGIVKSGILKSDLKLPHVLRYLYLVLREVQDDNDQDWVSFQVRIASKGERVNPFCSVEAVEDQDTKLDGASDPTASREDDKWMVLYLLFCYRYCRASNPTYQGLLFDKLKIQVAGVCSTNPPMPTPKMTYRAWLANKNFLKLIAVCDMFFFRYPNNDWAFCRFGTIVSRFRDCSALISLEHLREVTGMEGDDMFGWMFAGNVAREAEAMMEPNQEIDQPSSYMPYMMDLGLSLKSPYSASSSGAVYTYCHMACSLLMSNRSKHARMVSECNLANIRNIAVVLAYVFNKNLDLGVYFSKDKQIEEKLKIIEEGDQDDKDEGEDLEDDEEGAGLKPPASRDPFDWFCYLKSHGFQLTTELLEFARSESGKQTGLRQGTIGKHLAESFI